ncbi:MAG: hypothetical protein J7L63_05930 [Thermoplasmata archaeon]|nr:hypothetical protein [Thermoplasmata archaeon]
MEKLVAQAQVYYIIGYARDSSVYTDKKWVLGRVYLTDKRILFKKLDRYIEVKYDEIVSLEEREKYPRISPPLGWSRANILEIKHYEFGDKRHILTSLISANFDVTLKLRAIITKIMGGKVASMTELHRRVLLLLYLGVKNTLFMEYLLNYPENLEKVIEDLKFRGLINSDLLVTSEGTKEIENIRKKLEERFLSR